MPTRNACHVAGLRADQEADDTYGDVHVLNWGRQYGLLLPEVSGARHTFGTVFNRLDEAPLSVKGIHEN